MGRIEVHSNTVSPGKNQAKQLIINPEPQIFELSFDPTKTDFACIVFPFTSTVLFYHSKIKMMQKQDKGHPSLRQI